MRKGARAKRRTHPMNLNSNRKGARRERPPGQTPSKTRKARRSSFQLQSQKNEGKGDR